MDGKAVIARLRSQRSLAEDRADHYRRTGDAEMESFFLGKQSALSAAIEWLRQQESRIKPRDVECPTCEADPGYNCRGMDEGEVHFTRAMRV